MTDSNEVKYETVTFSTKRSLIILVRQEGALVRLFVPSTERVWLGESMRVRVAFADSDKTFFIHGKVSATQAAASGRPAGFDLTITTPEEFRAWSHVFAFCSCNQSPARRYPTSIQCSINSCQGKIVGFIRDLSMTGAFVVVPNHSQIPIGSTVTIDVNGGLFGLSKTQLKAEIVWQGRKHEAGGGIGASFTGGVQPVIELMKKRGVGA